MRGPPTCVSYVYMPTSTGGIHADADALHAHAHTDTRTRGKKKKTEITQQTDGPPGLVYYSSIYAMWWWLIKRDTIRI